MLLALAAFVFLPQAFALQAALPVAETMLLLVPMLAVCFLLGWWRGGRFWLALLWGAAAVAGIVLPDRQAGSVAAYADVARAWALMSAGTFGVVSLMAPRRPLFPRALAAIGLALLLGLMVLLVSGKSPQQVQGVFAEQIAARNRENAAELRTQLDALERQKVIQPGPTLTLLHELSEESVRQAEAIGRVAAEAFPALLALESLIACALAWALYHRLSRTRIGPPLAPLRDFRFNDQLVWGFVAGAVLVLLPAFASLRVLGVNLLIFFGAIYAVRGLGVIAWSLGRITQSGKVAGTLTVIGLLMLGPFAPLPALGLGLIDTWIDWRGRARPIS